MGRHNEDSISPNSNTNGVYPEQLQLKLYQAFIFSIPILFSIILFLLFYLFFLKRRALTLSSNRSSNHHHPSLSHPSFLTPPWIQGELKDKLNVVLFVEELSARDSLCCVCLGEFEMKEELRQLPFCRHVFHSDCIRHWLWANTTCPLCRHPLLSATKMGQPIGLGLARGQGSRNYVPQIEQQHAQGNMASSSNTTPISSISVEHVVEICEAVLQRQ